MIALKKAVLFDLDGVIALTEELKARAHVTTIHHFGGRAQPGLYARVMGQSHEAVRSAFIQASGAQVDPDAYTRIFREIYGALLDNQLEIRPGAKELVKELRERGYALAVVSSTSNTAMNKILTFGGLENSFDVRVSSQDVEKKKPDPEPYLLALARMEVEPGNAVVLEDSESGIEAARRANIPVIGVRHSYNINQVFAGTIGVVDSFLDVPHVIGLIEQSFH